MISQAEVPPGTATRSRVGGKRRAAVAVAAKPGKWVFRKLPSGVVDFEIFGADDVLLMHGAERSLPQAMHAVVKFSRDFEEGRL